MTNAPPGRAAPELYRNRRNGRTYEVYLRVIDCTNGREDTPMIVYGLEGQPPRFVREAVEFAVKFEPLVTSDD